MVNFLIDMSNYVNKLFFQIDGSLAPLSCCAFLYIAILASSLLVSSRSRRDLESVTTR